MVQRTAMEDAEVAGQQVKAGQRVRNRARVLALEDKGMGRWLLTTENTIEIEGQDKPAIVAVSLGMLIE